MNLEQLEHDVVLQTYKRFPLAIHRGKGAWVWDFDGNKYLDFLGGIAVNALGHCHPAITSAVERQIRTLSHVSNLYYTEPMIDLAGELVKLSGLDKVFYANSGAEANEAAIKLARKQHPDRNEIITCQQSFHGRTLATITATGQPKYQKGFDPLVPGFRYVPYNDIDALKQAITEKTAAVMLEPLQGEGGVVVPDEGYLPAVRRLCDEAGILMILDEVQSGCGRTGKFFCYEHAGITPDVVTLAKALGGGLPIGVCIASNKAAAGFTFGDHASTFGGGPVPCAAALAFLETLKNENLLKQAAELGEYFKKMLHQKLSDQLPITDIRGKGLMIGVELTDPVAGDIAGKCLKNGLLCGTAGPKVLRFLPPYTIKKQDIDLACEIISHAISQ